jgi:hypothetical protein
MFGGWASSDDLVRLARSTVNFDGWWERLFEGMVSYL